MAVLQMLSNIICLIYVHYQLLIGLNLVINLHFNLIIIN